jgi:hypothetical protein
MTTITDGLADREFCMPGPDDPLAPLRLIAAHQSTDPVLANVEQAVRDALSKLDSTAVPDEPGTDRFHVDTYSDGEVSVYGQFVQVHTEDGSNREVVRMSAQTEIGWRDLRVSLKTARELADALGVLFENIKHGGAA